MRHLLIFSIVLFSLFAAGQDYKLFDSDSKKLYTTDPIPGLTCGIDFDSVIMAGDFTVYFNYTGIGNELEPDTCEFWGAALTHRILSIIL